MQEIKLFIYVSPRRSGSTLLMSLMSQHSKVGVTSRLISRGNYDPQGFQPDYSIFGMPFSENKHKIIKKAEELSKEVILLKEEKGDSLSRGTKDCNECDYKVFPSSETIETTQPFFLFREPVRTFDGWKARNWKELDSFIAAYKSVFHEYKKAMLAIT